MNMHVLFLEMSYSTYTISHIHPTSYNAQLQLVKMRLTGHKRTISALPLDTTAVARILHFEHKVYCYGWLHISGQLEKQATFPFPSITSVLPPLAS